MAFRVYRTTFLAGLIGALCALGAGELSADGSHTGKEQETNTVGQQNAEGRAKKTNEDPKDGGNKSGTDDQAERRNGRAARGAPPGRSGNAPLRIVVVVNKKNPIESLSLSELRRIFLRKKGRWSNGWKITVFERHSENSIREAFGKRVLKKNPRELKKHWIDLKLSRGVKPPKVCPSTKILVQYLKRVKGGIGYLYEHEVDRSLLKIVNVKGLDAVMRSKNDDEQNGTKLVGEKDR